MIKVFLSSTGRDLSECREAVYKAICQVDDYHCVRMEDFGARDVPSVEHCSKRVADCDICVVIAAHMYGNCPVGSDKSFTETEYDAAVDSNLLLLVFIAPENFPVPADCVEGTGKQNKQKAFRKRLRDGKQVGTFNSPNGLGTQVLAALHNLDTGTRSSRAEDEGYRPAALATAPPVTDEEGGKAGTATPASEQRIEAARALVRVLENGELESVGGEGAELTDAQVARLLLTVRMLGFERGSREDLGTHETNWIYSLGDSVCPERREEWALWETLLSDQGNVMPGWRWVSPLDDRGILKLVWYSAMQAHEEASRISAIDLLQNARICVEPGLFEGVDVCNVILHDGSDRVRERFLQYLSHQGTGAELGHVQGLLDVEDVSIRKAASRTFWAIQARTSPREVAREATEGESPDEAVKEAFSRARGKLPPEDLVSALAAGDFKVRKGALDELIGRKALSKDMAKGLLHDKSLAIREACYKYLIDAGDSFGPEDIRKSLTDPEAPPKTLLSMMIDEEQRTDIDAVIVKLYRRCGFDGLREQVTWLSPNSPLAYHVLATEHWEKMEEQIRVDLESDFKPIFDQWVASIRNDAREQGKAVAEGLSDDDFGRLLRPLVDPEVGDFVRLRFRCAALSGLFRHGRAGDVAEAKKFLEDLDSSSSFDADLAAIGLIEREGAPADAKWLLKIARKWYGARQRQAVEAALKLSPGMEGAAKLCVESGDATLFRIATNKLAADKDSAAAVLIEKYLWDEDSSIRTSAVWYFIKTHPKGALESLLKRYCESRPHYYNVVCWFDRAIYSPEPFRAATWVDLRRCVSGPLSAGCWGCWGSSWRLV